MHFTSLYPSRIFFAVVRCIKTNNKLTINKKLINHWFITLNLTFFFN